jgi:hypothetical protein
MPRNPPGETNTRSDKYAIPQTIAILTLNPEHVRFGEPDLGPVFVGERQQIVPGFKVGVYGTVSRRRRYDNRSSSRQFVHFLPSAWDRLSQRKSRPEKKENHAERQRAASLPRK